MSRGTKLAVGICILLLSFSMRLPVWQEFATFFVSISLVNVIEVIRLRPNWLLSVGADWRSRVGLTLCLTWLLCAFAFEPWTYNNHGALGAATLFWWRIGASVERRATDIAWNRSGQWEIITEVPISTLPGDRDPSFEAFLRRQAYVPFHGYIASGVAMGILFLIPWFLAWVAKPLRGLRDSNPRTP